MRWLGFLAVLFAASSASAAPSSNPAFVGISMNNMGGVCVVADVTKCSPAEDAGLQFGDAIVAIDGKPLYEHNLLPCDVLIARITAHAPGDVTAFEVRRGSESATIKAALSTRADVQHRCLVGQPFPSFEVVDVDDHRTYELDELRGTTTILGLFNLQHLDGGSRVFDRVSDGIAKRVGGGNVRVLGLSTYDSIGPALITRKAANFNSTVPLAVTFEKLPDELLLKERDRVQFLVIDSRGIIRFVAPISPDSDDLEAAIDEVLAAAQQVEHARTQRR